MPNTDWTKLNHLQIGKYAEYYAKMEFASYGFEVYTSEVDDHGVDFIAKLPNGSRFYEVQVKSVRDYGYVYIAKSKMPILSENRLVCYLHFYKRTTSCRFCNTSNSVECSECSVSGQKI